MGNVTKKNGKYIASLNVKGNQINKSFNNEETANLWLKYKEELINDIEAFDPRISQMITLNDAIDFKALQVETSSKNKKSYFSFMGLKNEFSEIIDKSIEEITKEEIMEIMKRMLNTPTYKRRGSHALEQQFIPSIKTIRGRMALLSSVFSYQINQGAQIENPVFCALTWLRQNTKDESKDV